MKSKGPKLDVMPKEKGYENVWSGHQQWQQGQTSSLDHTGQ